MEMAETGDAVRGVEQHQVKNNLTILVSDHINDGVSKKDGLNQGHLDDTSLKSVDNIGTDETLQNSMASDSGGFIDVKESSLVHIEAQDDGKANSNTPGDTKHKIVRETVRKLFDKLVDDESCDSEEEKEVREEAKYVPYQILRKPVSERLPKAETRMYQNMLYTALVEDRLLQLEKSVKELERKKPEDESPQVESPKKAIHVPATRYLKWADFEAKPLQKEKNFNKSWEHRDPISPTPHSVLEVLIEEPQVNVRRRYRSHKLRRASTAELKESGTSEKSLKPDQTASDTSRLPIRLRIRSPLLVKILAKFLPQKDLGAWHRTTVTILRPFKLLVMNVEQIKEYLRELEEKHKEKTASSVHPKTEANAQDHSKIGETANMINQQLPIATSQISSTEEGHEEEEEPVNEIESYEALEHLRTLVKFMDEDLKYIWDIRQKKKEGTLRKIAFADLWHLFDYGQDLRTSESNGMQIYRVVAFTGGREPLQWTSEAADGTPAKKVEDYSQGAFFIQCYHLDFNGTQYGPKDTFFMVRRYEGEKDINTLPCFPLSCDPQEKQLREKLLERGNNFVTLSKANNAAHRHKTYTGLTIDKQQEQVDSQVIVDFQWALLKNPAWKSELGFSNGFTHDYRETEIRMIDLGSCGRSGCCGNDYIHSDYRLDIAAYDTFQRENKDMWDLIDNPDELDPDDKILLPYQAFGFVLRTRKWATFAIDLLKDVTYNDGWSGLELPDGHKETVLALVKNHAGDVKLSQPRGETFATMDLIRGKGTGLIILLHGEPGVGKTSTAECVADHTQRPLFPITCGDIGDNAEKVEENLENNFQLAHRWGCVLLLDEADVFLQKRDQADLARNAIVSVFLRTLEYYSGILFLTTNRVGTIDEAFRSRIHLSLLYPRLDKTITVKIWKNHLLRIQKQLKEDKKKFEIDKKSIIDFARLHWKELARLNMAPWNGRQIRNAFQTAMALAEYDAQNKSTTPKLSKIQFETVAKTSIEFDVYLKEVWGRDPAGMARVDRTRVDGVTAEELILGPAKLGAKVARQMAPNFPDLQTTIASERGKSASTKKGMEKPQLPWEANSEHSSDDEDLDTQDEE